MVTDKELMDAAGRVRRVESGERGRSVYGFDDEEMDDFMGRMLENAMTRDLKLLARAYLAEHRDDDGGELVKVPKGEVGKPAKAKKNRKKGK